MAGLDEVMERLLSDKEFRTRLAADRAGALAGYALSDDDREVLAATLTFDEGTPGVVERRTTQSSVAGSGQPPSRASLARPAPRPRLKSVS